MKFRFDDETKARVEEKSITKKENQKLINTQKRNAWKLPQNAHQLHDFDEMREKSVSLANLFITMSCHKEFNVVNEKEILDENHAIEKALIFL